MQLFGSGFRQQIKLKPAHLRFKVTLLQSASKYIRANARQLLCFGVRLA
jgi:hypothetical protein